MIAERVDGVLWQSAGEDEIPEPAIVVDGVSDVIVVQQGKAAINVNYESVPELIAMLRRVVKQHRPKQGGAK